MLNSLAVTHPEIAAEWHPTKNGELTPYDVMPNYSKKVWWLCEEEHEYQANGNHRVRGRGCPICNESRGEKIIANYLDKRGLKYIREYTFEDCRNIFPLAFDFAIFLNNNLSCLIEFDGEQHYRPIDYFGGKEAFIQSKKRDEIKNNYCKQNHIRLIRIPFNKIKEIDSILDVEISKLN